MIEGQPKQPVVAVAESLMRTCYDEANRIANHCSDGAAKWAMRNLYDAANEAKARLAAAADDAAKAPLEDETRVRLQRAGCPSCADGVWISAENHRAEVTELEERLRNLASSYNLVLKLAHELALELVEVCTDPHHETQVAELVKLMGGAGMKDNKQLSDS